MGNSAGAHVPTAPRTGRAAARVSGPAAIAHGPSRLKPSCSRRDCAAPHALHLIGRGRRGHGSSPSRPRPRCARAGLGPRPSSSCSEPPRGEAGRGGGKPEPEALRSTTPSVPIQGTPRQKMGAVSGAPRPRLRGRAAAHGLCLPPHPGRRPLRAAGVLHCISCARPPMPDLSLPAVLPEQASRWRAARVVQVDQDHRDVVDHGPALLTDPAVPSQLC